MHMEFPVGVETSGIWVVERWGRGGLSLFEGEVLKTVAHSLSWV